MFAIAMLLATVAPVNTQEATAAQATASCPAAPTSLPPELSEWVAMAPVNAAPAVAGAIALPIGSSVKATLTPSKVRFAAKPEKTPASGSYNGIFALNVTVGGRYRVALGSGAWIDLVKGRKSLTSVAHGHGPECTGIRKMVDFDLAPGKYTLQISGSSEPTTGVMVTRLS